VDLRLQETKDQIQYFQQSLLQEVELEMVEIIQEHQQVLFQLLLLAVKKRQVVQVVVQDKLIVVQVLNILVQVIIHQLVRLKEILEEEVLGQLPHQVQVIHLVVAVVVEQLL
jgi:hypothetical protein